MSPNGDLYAKLEQNKRIVKSLKNINLKFYIIMLLYINRKEEYMVKYEEFKDIKIENTGLMRGSSKDTAYCRLKKNGISNLKELFLLDDHNLIDYGLKNSYKINGYYLTKGVVKLLRTYYLNEELPFSKILNIKINNAKYILDNTDYKQETFIYELLQTGLSFNLCIYLRDSTYRTEEKTIIELLEDAYNGKIRLGDTSTECELNKTKIGVILSSYYEKQSIDIPQDLKLLKEKILWIKNNKNTSTYEFELEINRTLNSKLIELNEQIEEVKSLKKLLNNK